LRKNRLPPLRICMPERLTQTSALRRNLKSISQ
jgi:hypothetical protein